MLESVKDHWKRISEGILSRKLIKGLCLSFRYHGNRLTMPDHVTKISFFQVFQVNLSEKDFETLK